MKKCLKAEIIEPKFDASNRPSKLDPFSEKLAAWLKSEAAKPRKQRRTLKQMHSDLTALGFTGSYNRVAAFAREWRSDRQREQQTTGRGTFVPLAFRPGEAFQFDWSEDYAILGGERTKLQVAHMKLAHILALVLHHDEQAVLAAVEMALEAGVPTKTHVLNLLHRLIDGKTIDGPPLDTPQALILKHEPKANVARYDGLRAMIEEDRHAS